MFGVLFALSVITFTIFEVAPTGDPAVRIAGKFATQDDIALVRREWGFDKPLPIQYWRMMYRLVIKRDLVSYQNQANVVQELEKAAPRTFWLAFGAAMMWFVVGIALGLASFRFSGRWVDQILTVLTIGGISMPVFWLGTVLLYFLTIRWGHISALRWIPAGGYVPLTQNPLRWAQHLMLPWLVLAVTVSGYYARVLRAGLDEVANRDFIRAARAKGISTRRLLVRHTLRNAIVPLVALLGLDFSSVFAGAAILVEPIFGTGGIGQYAEQSISSLDFPPLMAITLFGGAAVVIVSTLTDIAQAAIDPRLRAS